MPPFMQQFLDQFAAQHGRGPRFDSMSAFVGEQLQHVTGRMYDRKFPFLDALEHVPAQSDVNPGAMSWSYDSFDMRGEAQFLAAGAHDLPRADVSAKRELLPIRTLVSSYGWNLEEMEAAAFANVPLSTKRSDAARRAIAEGEHRTVLFGEAGLLIPGWLTNASVPIMTVPNGSWLDPATTADKMLEDLDAIVTFLFTLTQKMHQVSAISLPNAHYRAISTKRIGVDSSMTVKKFFLEANNERQIEIKSLTELETAGPAGAPRGVGYEKSPENQSAIIPLAFQQLEPQMRGFEVLIPVRERVGGAVWYYPLSGVFIDGI